MMESEPALGIPVPEKVLRDLARNVAKSLPTFSEDDVAGGVNSFTEFISPILDVADSQTLTPIHRAAATNALCSIIEHCQKSSHEQIRNVILQDFVWTRMFNVYLQRSNEAIGKSMRQMLLVLTSVITKSQSEQALKLRQEAAISFLTIICQRQDRVKVKPALQGLAHFLQREVVSVGQLIEDYAVLTGFNQRSSVIDDHGIICDEERSEDLSPTLFVESAEATPQQLPRDLSEGEKASESQALLKAFLAWVVHHDTALSAGHLVKNYLAQLRRQSQTTEANALPIWVEPVTHTIQDWPDRIREFKTHVFPHCFQPNIVEYTRFLSYLHFREHVQPKGVLPNELVAFENIKNGLSGPEEFNILLVAIATGKELTIIKDSDSRLSKDITIDSGAIYLPDEIVADWMGHPDPDVRLAGMFLSVYSVAVTKPITSGVFKSLKRNLVHLHTDTDANFRREIHGYTQKLFDRLRASTATLAKGMAKGTERLPFPRGTGTSDTHDPLHEALQFVEWYTRFLEWEMRPTASYQRRITALRSMTTVLRSGIDPGVPFAQLAKAAQSQLNWAHGMQITNNKLVRVLLDLILDPFDDIRDAAVSVLQLCLIASPPKRKEEMLALIPKFLSRAEVAMLKTGRADQADGVARAYGLLFSVAGENQVVSDENPFSSQLGIFNLLNKQVNETLAVAHSNLSEAVNGRPVHGSFAALRYIIDQDNFYSALTGASSKDIQMWKNLHKGMIESIESLWNCVFHVLCADAPEGYLPEELEDEASLDTKEILSYSWRALKEASVLLRTVVTRAPISNGEGALVSPDLFEKLGQLCFTQLLELRHRGAHSTVSQTFAAFCRRCMTSDVEALRALPEKWYQESLSSIQDKAHAITRRSAGIPALISGIVAAEPQPGGKLFPRVMKDLIAEASVEAQSTNIEESRLPQVHALNCIKEIFTTSKLSVASEAYIGEGMELAARTLNSNIWPIRNCSLMLFKALIERLLGSDEAQDWKERDRAKTSRFSYNNYPGLINILNDLLDPEGALKQSIEHTPDSSSPLDLHGAEGVFPGLQILRQAQPPEENLQSLLASVKKLLESPHWHLRDMAARTVAALTSTDMLWGTSLSLLNTKPKSHNKQHGILLAVKYCLRRFYRECASEIHSYNILMKELALSASVWYQTSDCPTTRAAYLDIVSLASMHMLSQSNVLEFFNGYNELATSVSVGPEYVLTTKTTAGDALYRQSLVRALFIDRVVVREQMTYPDHQGLLGELIQVESQDPDTCCTALDTLREVLEARSTLKTAPSGLHISGCGAGGVLLRADILGHIHPFMLAAKEPEVISRAQAILADYVSDAAICDAFFPWVSKEDAIRTITHLETQCLSSAPSNSHSALHLLGPFLDHAYNLPDFPDPPFPVRAPEQPLVLTALARYIRLLRATTTDLTPFDTRLAAAQSLAALSHIWQISSTSKDTAPLLLGLSLILLDILSDDDDEIRILAAQATSNLLTAQKYTTSTSTVPLLTSHRLAAFLAANFGSSQALTSYALRKLVGAESAKDLFKVDFATTLASARHEDTALFATEKQNLYADASLDALLLSRILLASRPPPASTRSNLTTYVLAALSTFRATASTETDGALGWSSKDEVFALGVGVLCVVEVVFAWGVAGKEREGLMMEVMRFVEDGKKAGVHALWIERAENMLEREIVGGVRRVAVGGNEVLAELDW